VSGCNCTCEQLRACAGDFFALAVNSQWTVLVSRFSDGGVQYTSRAEDSGCWDAGIYLSALAGG
jgi:hypothetical protein